MLLTLSELTGHLDLDNIGNLTVLQASGITKGIVPDFFCTNLYLSKQEWNFMIKLN